MMYEIAFIGLIVSLAFIALSGYYPGGIIVPSYLVLFVDQPLRLAGTFIAAILAYLIYRFLSRYLILYGRRRFVILILLGAVFAMLITLVAPSFVPQAIELRVVGLVIPGLIAGTFDRQGVAITTASMATVIVAVYFIGKIWFLIS